MTSVPWWDFNDRAFERFINKVLTETLTIKLLKEV